MSYPKFLRRLSSALGLLAGLLLWACPTQATVLTSCTHAPTLPGGHYTLEADLHCQGFEAIRLEGASLDLQGHTLSCAAYFGPCVRLTGWGSRLGNGTIDGGAADIVYVEGIGGHYLYDLDVLIADGNMQVLSHWNLLVRVHVHSVHNPALRIDGMANWLASSTAHCPTAWGPCLWIRGHYNAVTWNLVTVEESEVGAPALLVSGHFNWLAKNTVTDVDGVSLRVSGQGNVLASNTLLTLVQIVRPAFLQGVDAQDLSGDCTHNTWLDNRGLVASPACLGLKPLLQSVGR